MKREHLNQISLEIHCTKVVIASHGKNEVSRDMRTDTSLNLSVSRHKQSESRSVALKIRKSILQNISCFCKVQWVQEDRRCCRSQVVLNEARFLENLFVSINSKHHLVSKEFKQENMHNTTSVPLVKSKNTLLVQALYAFPIGLIHRCSVWFIQSNLSRCNHQITAWPLLRRLPLS